MSQDPYRPPDAQLIQPGAPPAPRSALVAVLLGWLTPVVLSVPVGVALQRLGIALDDVFVALALSGGTGLLAGWIAARYRRGPWLGVALALVALDLAVTLPIVAFGIQSESSLQQFFVSAAGDLLGAYAARGVRAPGGAR